MRDIQELIDSVERYSGALIQRRFDSKKNTVAYVLLDGRPRVLKWFVPGLLANMEREIEILTKGAIRLPVPTLHEIDRDHNVLVLGYIAGTNLCDVVCPREHQHPAANEVMGILASWFSLFHATLKTDDGFCLRGDSSLRNFILREDGTVWGVDFEESRGGSPVDDIAGLCASLLATEPMFTKEKFALCRHFATAYRHQVPWPIENLNEAVSYALLERIQWRPQHEAALRDAAKAIRKHGLHR